MIKERDKARKILNVIVEYFVLHEFQNINANININEQATSIIIKGKVNAKNIDIAGLRQYFTHPRLSAYEDYYDGLLDSDGQGELNTIGYLIDEAEVNLDGDTLTINLIRKHI